MMRMPIPKEMREQLSRDPYMKTCILSPLFCEGRIEWNHGMTYAGKRTNELYSIVPMCQKHHKEEAQYRDAIDAAICQRIEFFAAQESFKEKYPKSDLLRGRPAKSSPLELAKG